MPTLYYGSQPLTYQGYLLTYGAEDAATDPGTPPPVYVPPPPPTVIYPAAGGFVGPTLEAPGSSGAYTVPTPVPGPPFYVVEVDAYRPPSGNGASLPVDTWGSLPWGALSMLPIATESYDTIRASDLGYRTSPADGVEIYPPYLDTAFAIDRKLNLDPTQPAAAAAWGSITFANPGSRYDALAASGNSDGRAVRIYAGRKVFDPARGYFMDPPRASLQTLFVGVAQNWFCSDVSLSVPLRDATYYLERPIQTATYGGTGALDGGPDLAGTGKPRARGYVRNVTPVLVDSVNRIYQWSDGPVQQITALYEGGTRNILPANAGTGPGGAPSNDVADLYSGSVASGYYRTCGAKGLFQLGVAAVRQITLDGLGGVTANMGPLAVNSSMRDLALGLILDDIGVPPAAVDIASFGRLPTYGGGYYLSGSATDGATLLGEIAASVGAKVFPARDGRLSALVLRALPADAQPVATFDTSVAMSCVPVALGATLDPPPWRYQIGYAHAYTVQTADLNGSITAAQRQFIAQADRFAVRQSGAVLNAYRRPTDPPPIPTQLANAADAGAVAASLVALWSTRRRLYNVTLPVSVGILRDIGDVVMLRWPMDDLRPGRLGQIVGEQFRGGDSTIVFQVLV